MDATVTEVASDIPRALTAVAEWGACLVYILLNRRRGGMVRTAVTAVAALASLLAVQISAGALPLALWIPGMLCAAAIMLLFIFASVRVSTVTAGYLTARAFVLAELTASVHWQLDRFYLTDAPIGWHIGSFIGLYSLVLGLAWWVENRHFRPGEIFDVGRRELTSAVAIAAATFAISNLSFATADTAFSGRLGHEIFYIRTLVDLSGYIALYVQHQLRQEMKTRRDAEAMAQLIRNQRDQYEISRRAIEDVNRKYHDMKHHLGVLRGRIDPQAREHALDELELSIGTYGDQVRSGNPVVDAVLSSALMKAREQGIELSSVVDGELLNFVGVLDITTILGNALDNALEGALRAPDPARRQVRVALFGQQGFVVMKVENIFDGVISRRQGDIITRKVGAGHGYGLRNIEAATERLGGTVRVDAAGEWFSLVVLIPHPDDASSGA